MDNTLEQTYFQAHPERDIPLVREALQARVPCKGLTPLEVMALSCGSPRFTVEADPQVWAQGTPPMAVLRAQTGHPDGSLIRIVIEDAAGHHYEVRFAQGRAQEVCPA